MRGKERMRRGERRGDEKMRGEERKGEDDEKRGKKRR